MIDRLMARPMPRLVHHSRPAGTTPTRVGRGRPVDRCTSSRSWCSRWSWQGVRATAAIAQRPVRAADW